MSTPRGTFKETTPYETEILKAQMEEYLPALVHYPPPVIQRYFITTTPDGAVVNCITNDDDDDGYPDGRWVAWEEEYPSVEKALAIKGKCRIGISGVIVTVTLDGKEIR
jgi:hypothetical protein